MEKDRYSYLLVFKTLLNGSRVTTEKLGQKKKKKLRSELVNATSDRI